MYPPKYFQNSDPEPLFRLIRANPLAALVTGGSAGPRVDHVPMVLDVDERVLCGHIARINPLAQCGDSVPALAVFSGADSYISPAWYPGKAQHGRVVPTWNYTAVHVGGSLRLVDDPDWLMAQLRALTAQQESDSPNPWAVGDAPAAYIEKLRAAIVGVELPLETLEGKWKVSQNQNAETRAAVVRGLRERSSGDDLAMAALVEAG